MSRLCPPLSPLDPVDPPLLDPPLYSTRPYIRPGLTLHHVLHALPQVELKPQSMLVFSNSACIHQFRNIDAADGTPPEALSIRMMHPRFGDRRQARAMRHRSCGDRHVVWLENTCIAPPVLFPPRASRGRDDTRTHLSCCRRCRRCRWLLVSNAKMYWRFTTYAAAQALREKAEDRVAAYL